MIKSFLKHQNNLTVHALVMGSLLFFAFSAGAVERVNKDTFGVAIKGYDPVAYFTEGRAVKGSSQYTVSWNEASWYFSTAAHRDKFAAEPDRYAPQYGGY